MVETYRRLQNRKIHLYEIQNPSQSSQDIIHTQSTSNFNFIFVDLESFERHRTKSFEQLMEDFQEYKDE